MVQLTKGMYGSESNQTGDLFGLACGQMCSEKKITHNSGWYNRSGEKLGWGDLNAEDFARIARELDAGEFFIILSEQDSRWKVPEGKEEDPGVLYVAEHALYIITRNQLFRVDDWGYERGRREEVYGLTFIILIKQDVKAFIKHSILQDK
ncbi:MAG: hypothetical protein NTZ13_03000 [Candidatus Parcubacteria bacterium]|nr:hypothetical protein [Candidatus Parcubacteria bacterium]